MKKHFFFFIMVIGVATGALLRLYRIGSQIIWDDEWHGIHVALFNPIKYILTHFHADDNCIPLSIYFRIMLKYIGLNEIIIRFPSLLSGLLILAIFPLCVKRLLNEKVAMTFIFLLAISPLLVYFSRLARPYSLVVLLSFIAIFAFYLWMAERKTIFAVIYLISAVLAPYFSVSSLAFILAPILYALMISLLKKKRKLKSSWENIPPLKHIAVVTIVVLAGIAVWMLPAVGTLTEVTNKSGQGFINLGTMGGCAVLFGGARSYILSLILILVFLYGSYVLYLKNKLLFSYLSIICFLQLLFLVLSRPFLVQSSIIFTRYYISSIPVWLLIISIALNDLRLKLTLLLQNITKMANVIPNLILAALFLIIFLKGPISLAYSYPNDFTNHQDFQYYYLKPVPRINNHSSQSCPEFYFSLRNGSGHYTIVEFPAILSWYWKS